eukprot:931635-Amphidinium_carterae.1
MRTNSALMTIEESTEADRPRKRKDAPQKASTAWSKWGEKTDTWWSLDENNKENWSPHDNWTGASASSASSSQVDPWARYGQTQPSRPTLPATRSDPEAKAQIDSLQKRVADIEQAQTSQLDKTTKLETRLTSVESGVTDMRSAMQLNFDRLFDKFEQMNS